MDDKHTPGPWAINMSASDPYKWIGVESDQKRDNWNCLRALVECDDCNSEMAMANAHLLAAAPELLTALRDALSVMEEAQALYPDSCGMHSRIGAIDRARAAIAKAKGGAA